MIEVRTLEVLSPAVPKVYEVDIAVEERGSTVSPSIQGMEIVTPILWLAVMQLRTID